MGRVGISFGSLFQPCVDVGVRGAEGMAKPMAMPNTFRLLWGGRCAPTSRNRCAASPHARSRGCSAHVYRVPSTEYRVVSERRGMGGYLVSKYGRLGVCSATPAW